MTISAPDAMLNIAKSSPLCKNILTDKMQQIDRSLSEIRFSHAPTAGDADWPSFLHYHTPCCQRVCPPASTKRFCPFPEIRRRQAKAILACINAQILYHYSVTLILLHFSAACVFWTLH